MRLSSFLTLAVSLLPSVLAVYDDEAFQTDYHIPLLGTVLSPLNTFFHRPTHTSPASLLYSLTNRLVLGAIHPRDGSLVWRQQLGHGSVSEAEALLNYTILRKGSDGNIVTAVKGDVGLWDAGSGRKIWGNVFVDEITDLIVLDKEAVVVIVFKKGQVKGLDLLRGEVKWESNASEGHDEALSLRSGPNRLHVILHNPNTRRLKVVLMSANTGAHLETHLPDSYDTSAISIPVPAFLPVAAWTDGKQLKLNLAGQRFTSLVNLKEEVEIAVHAATPKEFVVSYVTGKGTDEIESWAEVYEIGQESMRKMQTLPTLSGNSVFSVSASSNGILISRISMEEVVVYSSASSEPVNTVRLTIPLTSEPLHCQSEVVKRADGTYTARTSITLEDGNLVLLRDGDITWIREESLASAVASEWIELHDSEEGLERALLAEESSNAVSAYVHRVKRHLADLQHLPKYLAGIPASLMSSFGLGPIKEAEVQTGNVRDTFGLRKFALFVTRFGGVTAIDGGNQGAVLWRLHLDTKIILEHQVKGLFQLRKGVFVIILENRELYEIDVFKGEFLNKDVLPGKLIVESSSIVDAVNGDKKWIVILPTRPSAQGWIYPQENVTGVRAATKNTWLTQRFETGVRGVSIKVADGFRVRIYPSWTFYPPASETLTSLVTRPPHDPIASIGKVLGDRSVLYKYLNPHLLLLTTINQEKHIAQLYLLDSVSGMILHTTTHTEVDTSRPVVSTLSENWFVYSFYSDSSAKGYQIVISELYASALKNDRGPLSLHGANLSSFEIPRSANPHVISQAYMFPHQIAAMQTTATRQGITTRSVIMSIPSIGSLITLPKRLLNPRRPVARDLTADEKEEGLYKYEPAMGVDFQHGSLSHSRELLGVYKIMTSPALLESTCLVMGWGLDVFGTRVAPSETFDILGKGFNKLALLATVVALAVGTGFMGPMVRKKQINQRWLQ